LGLGRSALWRTRAAYCEGGLGCAQYDAPRPGHPRKYQTDQEAEVVALACSAPPGGRKRWTVRLLTIAPQQRPGLGSVNRDTIRQMLKNDCKPWRKLMCCVGRSRAEYRKRMNSLLRLYARPYNAKEPVVFVDEKSKQLLRQTRSPLPLRPGRCAKEDYEYRRAGTRNIFMAVEAKGERRVVGVTARAAPSRILSHSSNTWWRMPTPPPRPCIW